MEAESAPAVCRVPVRGAAGVVLPIALPAALAGAVKGITLLHERSGTLLSISAGSAAGGLLVVVLLLVSAVCLPAGRTGAALLLLGSLLVLLGAAAWLTAAVSGSDQRALHDRGVVASGVIYAHRQYGGGGGTVDLPLTLLSDVQLADGSTLSVEATGSERPAVNSEVSVTYDPQDRVPARFGSRPGLPGTTVTTVAEAMVVTGALCLSAVLLSRRTFAP
ncbi:hypothetical protein [Kitasatospora sp. P5_F3]